MLIINALNQRKTKLKAEITANILSPSALGDRREITVKMNVRIYLNAVCHRIITVKHGPMIVEGIAKLRVFEHFMRSRADNLARLH